MADADASYDFEDGLPRGVCGCGEWVGGLPDRSTLCGAGGADASEHRSPVTNDEGVVGDAGIYGAMLGKLPRSVHAHRDALTRHLSRMTRERHARYNGTFLVHGSDVLVESVSSTRMSVAPGELGVPMTVTLFNKGLCPVDGLVVEPLLALR